jgi:hypothetical protein
VYKVVPNKIDSRDELSESMTSFENLSTYRSFISNEPSLIEFNGNASKVVDTDRSLLMSQPQTQIIEAQKPYVSYAVSSSPIFVKSIFRSEPMLASKKIWKIKYIRNDSYNKLK